MNISVSKVLAVGAVILGCLISQAGPTNAQSTNWSVTKTCGKALSAPPLKGSLWAAPLRDNPNFGMDTITDVASTDAAKIPVHTINSLASSYLSAVSQNEMLYRVKGRTPSDSKIIVLQQDGRFKSANLDESNLNWFGITPSSRGGHYNVWALDNNDNLFLLDVTSADSNLSATIVSKIPYIVQPREWNSVGAVSVSPDGKYVTYGDVLLENDIFSVENQKVIATFKTPIGALRSNVVWSMDQNVLAYVYAGGFTTTWKLFSVGYDGANQEIFDLKSIIGDSALAESGAGIENQNGQIIGTLTNSNAISMILVIDIKRHQISDICITGYIYGASWIDNDHLLVVESTQEGNLETFSLIVSTQTSDYFKITYAPTVIPVGWMTDSSVPTPTPNQ